MPDSTKPLIIVTHALPDSWINHLRENYTLLIGPEGGSGLTEELQDALPEADALITLLVDPIDAQILARAPHLKVVSNMAVGVDNIDLQACTRRRIPVGHTPGILTAGTADLTWALLLACARNLPRAQKDAQEGRWTTWDPTGWLGMDLEGATLGIIGMGKIGTAVAQRSSGFGLKLLFANRSPRPDLENELGASQVSFSELLRESDFLSLHVPLNDGTHHLIDRQALKAMKSSAILINAARGAVVDTDALLEALDNDWIAGAGLDVTDPEPLPPDHPLYHNPRCLILPHIGSATHHTRKTMAYIAGQNAAAGLAGNQLPHCANPEVYSLDP
jgi:phosphoglycerate dehydrogenase-like enzyme